MFDGTSTLPRGFAASKQVTTVATPPLDKVETSAVRTTRAVDGLDSATQRVRPSLSRLGGTVGEVGAKLGRGSGQLGQFTSDLGLLAGGFGAAEIAGEGLSYLLRTSLEQTATAVDKLTTSGEALQLQGLFDPTKLERYGQGAKEIAGILGEVTRVEPSNLLDKIGDAVGAYDLRLFGDSQQEGNQAAAKAAEIEKLAANLTVLGEVAGRRLLDSVRAQMIGLGISAKDADATLGPLYKQIADTAAAERGAGALEKITTKVDRFGFAVDAAKTRNQQYSDSLGKSLAPIEAAGNALDALGDGQRTLAEAQEKYQDIVDGNTDGLKSAAESLRSARDDLAKAVAETGPGSKAARDAAGDVRDALRAYRDLQVEIGKGPAEGDFFDPRTQDLADAYENIIDAQDKLKQIESGNSDQVVSAREREAAAQKAYNDELAKTGPNSKEAADALEVVQDAQRALPGLAKDYENALRDVNDEAKQHPEAIQASIDKVDEWLAKGLISVEVARQWKEELLLVAAASRDVPPGAYGPTPAAPTRNPDRNGDQPSGTAPKRAQVISDTDAYAIGIDAAAAPSYLSNGDVYQDDEGRSWKYRESGNKWVAQFRTGGYVGPGGGEVHEGEVVLNRSTVQKYGASNLLALQTSASAPAAVAALPSTTGAASSGLAELLSRLVDGQEALRVDIVNTLRALAKEPDGGVAWLMAIEANTRRPAVGPSVESVQARTAQFV